jgi:hypothetical protein
MPGPPVTRAPEPVSVATERTTATTDPVHPFGA